MKSSQKRESGAKTIENVFTRSGEKMKVTVPGNNLPQMVSITLENIGNEAVVFPKVVANGSGDWSDMDAIMAEIVKPGMTEREKAMAIWTFVMDNRCHDHPAYGDGNDTEIHDPVKLFNCYGWGLCDDCAYSICYLAKAAGLESVPWSIAGHVLPEIRFGGRWGALDADHQIFYLMGDGRSIAGVRDWNQDPSECEVEKRGSKWLASKTERYKLWGGKPEGWWWWPKGKPHTMNITLRPGEQLIRYWDNEGKYVSARDRGKTPPPLYANGRIIYDPPLTAAAIEKWAAGSAGINPGKPRKVSAASDKEAGWIAYRIETPYPVAAAHVEGRFTRREEDALKLYVSLDGEKWGDAIRLADKTGAFSGKADISAVVNTHDNSEGPTYSYYIKLEMVGPGAAVEALRIVTVVQIAPRSLPVLINGENEIVYTDKSASRKVRLEYGFIPDAVKLPQVVSVSPKAGAEGVPKDVVLEIGVDRDLGKGRRFGSCDAALFSEDEFVDCELTQGKDLRTLRVAPVRPLASGTKYTAFIHRRALWPETAWGVAPQPIRSLMWSFKTAGKHEQTHLSSTDESRSAERPAETATVSGRPEGRTHTVYEKWPFAPEEAKRRQEETSRGLKVPLEKTLDLGGGVKLDFVLIPAGEFEMGSRAEEEGREADEGPVHKVRITRPFYLGKFEVTQKAWQQVMGDNPSYPDAGFRGEEYAVGKISWNDAQEFVTKLNERFGGEHAFRLPTEAEWEYACRAGTPTPFHFGETISTDQANYDGNYAYGRGEEGVLGKKPMLKDHPRPVRVGSFPPNAWGLFDMHGNGWEWCWDRYGENYYQESPRDDPGGPRSGAGHVFRGGSWGHDPRTVRSAYRNWGDPMCRYVSNGLRLVVAEVGF